MDNLAQNEESRKLGGINYKLRGAGNKLMKIMLADKETLNVKILGDFLDDLGHEVTRCNTITRACELATDYSNSIDLMILDTGAPKGENLNVIQEIHRLYPSADLLIMSRGEGILSFQEAISQGVFAYLNKPVRLSELELLVTRVGEKRSISV